MTSDLSTATTTAAKRRDATVRYTFIAGSLVHDAAAAPEAEAEAGSVDSTAPTTG